jgi:hypothetical protein
MVVHDFHVDGTEFCPHKTNAKLSIDANAVLSGAILLQGLKLVSPGNAEIAQRPSRIQ